MEPLPYSFSHEEVDLLVCALLRYQTELRSRSPLMERFATPEHLANHLSKIARGEALLERFK
jgi:uncharacterized protein YceH (UPF0502 family)